MRDGGKGQNLHTLRQNGKRLQSRRAEAREFKCPHSYPGCLSERFFVAAPSSHLLFPLALDLSSLLHSFCPTAGVNNAKVYLSFLLL